MGSIWAVARHTFAQCLRMKMAAAFIIMLAAALGAMPFLMKGDGTLAGQIRTFLAYGTGITGLLLTMVTIFVAAGVVSFDVRDKQVFTVATKPIARWQYVLGRWAGVVMLDAVLLGVAGGAIYGFAQYLRQGAAVSAPDRRAVEAEVFAARNEVRPDDPNIEPEVQARIARLVEANRYRAVVESFKARTGGDDANAIAVMEGEIRREISQALQSAGPGEGILWTFSGVRPEAQASTGTGRIARWFPFSLLAKVQADPVLISNLVPNGPVEVNGVPGRVARMEADNFTVQFAPKDAGLSRISDLAEGRDVPIVVEPTIQITYKPSPVGRSEEETLVGRWTVFDTRSGYQFSDTRTDPVRMVSTFTVPARAVGKDGRLDVAYVNLSPASVMILNQDVAVLYRVGAFEPNFLRAMLLVLLQLAFVAAVAVFAASFLSFPVASIVCFAVLPFGLARSFLAEAVRPPVSPEFQPDLITRAGGYVFYVMKAVLPDLERTSPADQLVDGRYISWMFLGETALWTFAVSTVLALALACLIFQRRELARVQV